MIISIIQLLTKPESLSKTNIDAKKLNNEGYIEKFHGSLEISYSNKCGIYNDIDVMSYGSDETMGEDYSEDIGSWQL